MCKARRQSLLQAMAAVVVQRWSCWKVMMTASSHGFGSQERQPVAAAARSRVSNLRQPQLPVAAADGGRRRMQLLAEAAAALGGGGGSRRQRPAAAAAISRGGVSHRPPQTLATEAAATVGGTPGRGRVAGGSVGASSGSHWVAGFGGVHRRE